MPDFLTRRNGTWHFVRRVPVEFETLDKRGVIKHSTRIRIADDRAGRRALRVAEQLNAQLENFWKGLSDGHKKENLTSYDTALRAARSLGFEYVEGDVLLRQRPEVLLDRLEAIVKHGALNERNTWEGALGTEKQPAFMVSELFIQYEAMTKDEVRDLAPDQLRIWRNGRRRAVERFVQVNGDKPVNQIERDDGIKYTEWWRSRVVAGETEAKTANKDIGQLSRMLKDVSIRKNLNIPDVFKDLRLKGEVDRSRLPYETSFIQKQLLAKGALDGLNEDARLVLYVVADTGLRPTEVVNLPEKAIVLGAPIPHLKVLPEGRRLKTVDSERDIPLVGVALAAMKKRPKGFPRYRGNSSGLSAVLNKYLQENNLRPTKDHTVYSLRHSFKDRLIAAEAPDSLIDSLMGHRTNKPKYGKGPSLELKLKYLQRIAFKAPPSL